MIYGDRVVWTGEVGKAESDGRIRSDQDDAEGGNHKTAAGGSRLRGMCDTGSSLASNDRRGGQADCG